MLKIALNNYVKSASRAFVLSSRADNKALKEVKRTVCVEVEVSEVATQR